MLRRILFAFSFLSLFTFSAKAQLAGGELTYVCKGNNQYEVKLVMYAKCSGSTTFQPKIDLSYFSGNSNTKAQSIEMIATGGEQTIPACIGQKTACEGGTGESADAIKKKTYVATLTLPSKQTDWKLIVQEGPRAELTNATKDYMNLTATVNNTGTICNSSISFDNNPQFFSAADQQVVFDPGIKSTDTDKLKIELVSPKNSDQTPITYTNGLSAKQPFATNGAIQIDANGKLTFTPTKPSETSVFAMKVTETRNGVEVGSVVREMYFQTMAKQASPPMFISGDSLKFCQGDPINIEIVGASNTSTAQLNMVLNNPSAWPGAAPKIEQTGTTVKMTFSSASFSGVRPLNVTLVDNNCGAVTKTFYARVNPKPVITTPVPTIQNVVCLKPFDISVDAIGAQPLSYLWSPTGETTKKVTVTSATNYRVVVTDKNGCTASWTKQIKSPVNFVRGQGACVDSVISVYDVSAGILTNPVSAANPLAATTNWSWQVDGMTVPGNSSTLAYKFPENKTYRVTMNIESGNDCKNSITKNVKIYGKPTISFGFIDTCVHTEFSDLVVADVITGGDTTIKRTEKVDFYVNGVFSRKAGLSSTTSLGINKPGNYEVRIEAKNEAGCVRTLTKKSTVRAKPLITLSPLLDHYYYRCDLAGFPDTTFDFKGTPVGDALAKPFNTTIERTGMATISTLNDVPNRLITVPYTIVQNATSNKVTFKIKDGYGCTNDTSVDILDPVTPKIQLDKYYCFLADTLKLSDITHTSKGYHWELASAKWNMKDGKTDTTIGFVRHAYDSASKSLEEATIVLKVQDNKKCVDSTTFDVYLSEPDTSEFKIVDPLSCYRDTVDIFGIKNKYINSWYYRYTDTTASVYDNPDKVVINVNGFGSTIPPNLDEKKVLDTKRYAASTTIFYNEKDSNKNFVTEPFPPYRVIVPRTPTNVCKVKVTKDWRVVEKLRFSINDTYDHCFDSTKKFEVTLIDSASKNMKVKTETWTWTLMSPQNVKLDEFRHAANDAIVYQPATSLFTQVATVRPGVSGFTPYTIKVRYDYHNDTITCTDSTTLQVANEKVSFKLDENLVTCALYSTITQYKDIQFLESEERKSGTVWNYGNGTSETGYPGTVRYDSAGTYQMITNATNKYGCSGSDTMVVKVKPSPTANLRIDPVCFGNETIMDGSKSRAADTLSASSKITHYFWYYSPKIPQSGANIPDTSLAFKDTKESILIDKFEVGSYPVGLAVLDSNGCYAQTEVQLAKVNPLPVIDFTATAKLTQDQDYLGHEPIEFKEQTVNGSYWRWNFGDNTAPRESSATDTTFDVEYVYPYYAPPFPIEKNKYNVTLFVRTKDGCKDSVTKTIDVNAYFKLPTAFSPNEDGLHDQLLGVGKGIKEIKEFKVFNRWGEVIYSVSGKPEKDELKRGYLLWDGKFNGQVQPVGAYVYYAVVTTGYGNDLILKGNMTLLR